MRCPWPLRQPGQLNDLLLDRGLLRLLTEIGSGLVEQLFRVDNLVHKLIAGGVSVRDRGCTAGDGNRRTARTAALIFIFPSSESAVLSKTSGLWRTWSAPTLGCGRDLVSGRGARTRRH